MAQVFLCYSHEDTEYASRLAAELSRRGIEFFDYAKDIPAGSDWLETIQDNLNSCSIIVPILTHSAHFSNWVDREINYARERQKAIWPLLLDGEVWPALKYIHIITDVTDGNLPQEAFFETVKKIIEESKSTERLSNSAKRTKEANSKDATNKLFDVYISYNSNEVPDLAEPLAKYLQNNGLGVWFYKWYVKETRKDYLKIEREALELCNAFVFLIGPQHASSGQIEELILARSFPQVKTIWVLLPDTNPDVLRSDIWSNEEWVDLRTGMEDRRSIDHLTAAIKGEQIILDKPSGESSKWRKITPQYSVNPIEITLPGVGARPIEMPVNILLGLPAYVTEKASLLQNAFNLPGALAYLQQNYPNVAPRVVKPHIWAPGLDDEALKFFAAKPLLTGSSKPIYKSKNLRIYEFPSHDANEIKRGKSRNYEIVHFLGRLDPAGSLVLEEPGNDLYKAEYIDLETLAKALKRTRTRLLILDLLDPWEFDAGRLLSQKLTTSLGMAVLIVVAKTAKAREDYFIGLYANILHNRPLVEMAVPPLDPSLNVELTYPEGADDLLNFTRWMDQMEEKLSLYEVRVLRMRKYQEDLNLIAHSLHQTQQMRLTGGLSEYQIRKSLSRLEDSRTLLTKAREQRWDHEENSSVLPGIHQNMREFNAVSRAIERLASQPDIIQEELKNAPRVLNANFSIDCNSSLQEKDTLIAKTEYPFLVDIGPKWDKLMSLVTGNQAFPEEALPPGNKGYVIDVVLISEDFTPHINKAQIWLPANSGRSFPYSDEKKAEVPGPVVFMLTTPEIPEGEKEKVKLACGRLCLYFENNLLQSALVSVGVAALPGMEWEGRNEIHVDYALTGSFCGIDSQLGKRKVTISRRGKQSKASVSVNLTLNDDGAGGHRIVTKYRVGSDKQVVNYPPAFKRYDPEVGKDALQQFRTALLDSINPLNAPPDQTPHEKLRADLLALAKIGSHFRRVIFSDLELDKPDPDYEKNLLYNSLAEATVIQISRTAPATYVFPWALIYDIPVSPDLPIDRYNCCQVIYEEWDENAQRQGPPAKACPHQDEPSHQLDNCICPYSFWGYKHIIEQPLSIWKSDKKDYSIPVADKVLVGPNVILSIGVTKDKGLDPDALEAHLDELRKLTHFNPESPADDQDKARDMLIAPQIVYFMCHGEGEEGQTYISIGERDNNPLHKITADDIGDWKISRQRGLDNAAWLYRRPLIFINGCHTADIRPGLALSLVTSFSDLYAGAVIGTEVSVLTKSAYPAAQYIMKRLLGTNELGQNELGEAVRGMRWDLLNRGDLSGLAYTPYSLANLKVVFEI